MRFSWRNWRREKREEVRSVGRPRASRYFFKERV